MKAANSNCIVVPFDGCTPQSITPEIEKIEKWNGVFERFVETLEFIFFVNEGEGDDNESTIMFRKEGMALVSDNYFASAELFDIVNEWQVEITFLSESAKEMIDSN